jgi:type VI secretion system protein
MIELQHPRRYIYAAILLTAVACSGCSVATLSPSHLIKPHLSLAVKVANDANINQPVALDFVSINDKDLAKDVSKMTAADWFQKRDQITQDFKPAAISIRSWEWVPGQVVPDIMVPMRKAPRAILVFAHYSTPGPHRALVDPSKPSILMLDREDMKLEFLDKKLEPLPNRAKN